MKPTWQAENVTLYRGNCLDVLAALPDQSVQCWVTSPPYWGAQRDYDNPGQLGMESTPEEYINALSAVFLEVRRVLRNDGVLWLNLGDSYAASGKGGGGKMMLARGHQWGHRAHLKGWRSPPAGYKQKDLVGIPPKVAERLRADGWYLRRDVIWDKGSATEPTRLDRPTTSHEYLYLFSKATRYQFDAKPLPHGSVWHVQPDGYAGHNAAFPVKLIEPCILAGCPAGGVVGDPFAGSGTTGIVAVRHGREFIGIELNKTYAALIRERLAKELAAPQLFPVQPSKQLEIA